MERIPGPDELTRDEAERLLRLYGGRSGQERMVLAANRLGISAARIHHLSGIARDTVARILNRHTPTGITITWRPGTMPDTVGEETELWGGLERRARDLVLGQAWMEHKVILGPDAAIITIWPERHAPAGAWERTVAAARQWAEAETAAGAICTVDTGKA